MKRTIIIMLIVIFLAWMLHGLATTFRDAPPSAVPDYKQADPRWASRMYSNHGDPTQTIKSGGCGLCAMANVVAYFCDKNVTPAEMAELSMRTGHCSDRGGTYLSFHTDIVQYYPLRVIKSADIRDAIVCLDQGGLVIAQMDGGVWNAQYDTALHAVTIYAHAGQDMWLYDSSVSDPLMSRIMGHGKLEKIAASARWYYCYYKTGG